MTVDRDAFWTIIDKARKSSDDVYGAAAVATELLAELSVAEIVSFAQHQSDLRAEAYRWDLWAVAYIINGGCSDDGFMDFQGWLMANGRKRWEAAMASPESIGKWAEPDGASCEEMLYVAEQAHEAKTGKPIPAELLTVRMPSEPVGEPWSEDRLDNLYPDLCEKFS